MKPEKRQSIFDVALQHGGDVASIFSLAETNKIGITDDLREEMFDAQVESKEVVSFYSVNGIIPATAPTAYELEQHPVGGINYMGIEIDFIVS